MVPPSFHDFVKTIQDDLARLIVFGKCEHFVRDKFLLYLREKQPNVIIGKEVTLSDLHDTCEPIRPDIVARYPNSESLCVWQFKAASKPNTLTLGTKLLSDFEITQESLQGVNYRYFGVGWVIINSTNNVTNIPAAKAKFYDRNIAKMFSTDFSEDSYQEYREKIKRQIGPELHVECSQLILREPVLERSINLLVVTVNA
jgi:hypothetical protein